MFRPPASWEKALCLQSLYLWAKACNHTLTQSSRLAHCQTLFFASGFTTTKQELTPSMSVLSGRPLRRVMSVIVVLGLTAAAFAADETGSTSSTPTNESKEVQDLKKQMEEQQKQIEELRMILLGQKKQIDDVAATANTTAALPPRQSQSPLRRASQAASPASRRSCRPCLRLQCRTPRFHRLRLRTRRRPKRTRMGLMEPRPCRSRSAIPSSPRSASWI